MTLEVIANENMLIARLQSQGADVYTNFVQFAKLRDRLAHAIVINRYAHVIADSVDGHPESYQDCFQRLYGTSLKDVTRKLQEQRQEALRKVGAA